MTTPIHALHDELHELRQRLNGALADNADLTRRLERASALVTKLELDLEEKTHALHRLMLEASGGVGE